MQRITICFCLAAFFTLTNCDRENFNEVVDIPEEVVPTEVEYMEGIALRVQNQDIIVTEGSAKRFMGGGITSYAITSGTITCESSSGYSTSYDGQHFFVCDFYEFDGDYYVTNAGITTEVDGQPAVLFSLVPTGSGCPERSIELMDVNVTEDEVSGTFTGNFFKLDGPLSDDLPCGGFVYVGEYTASFSMPYEDCQ